MQEEIINILNNKDKSYTITEINDLLGLTTIEEYQTPNRNKINKVGN